MEPETVTRANWVKLYRPGFFGRRRDQIINELNRNHGEGNWELRWCTPAFPEGTNFVESCIIHYEFSYLQWFRDHMDELQYIAENYAECIDNAPTNVESGCDYTKQEAFSTHIQDIAVRNVMRFFSLKFKGPDDKILVIRSADSEGYRFGPGNIPFHDPLKIEQPSKCPKWAHPGSVEDFWQSNKWVMVKR